MKRERTEVEGECVSVIFDGTSRLREILAVVLRFIDGDFKIQQCLVLLIKSMTGELRYSKRADKCAACMSPSVFRLTWMGQV